MKQKLLLILALLCAVAQGAWAENVVNLSTVTSDYVAQDGDVLTGKLNFPVKISIAKGAKITLRDATIIGVDDDDYEYAGITCLGDATITLERDNRVCGNYEDYPGILLGPWGTTLTIKGDGSLDVSSNSYAPGIGSYYNYKESKTYGNLTIEGGNITAYGGDAFSLSEHYGIPAIGATPGATIGSITLKGGTIHAYGGKVGAGIGTGYDNQDDKSGYCGTITIDGSTVYAYGSESAGIGAGGWRNGKAGVHSGCHIHIISGYVYAKGGEGSAGIGGGHWYNGGYIIIDGGTIFATGGDDGAGIGGGTEGWGGTIVINGGTIEAKGGAEAAGIGGGEDGYGGEIFINGGHITATGGKRAAGIGGGEGGTGGDIYIYDGDIKAYGGEYGAGIGGGDGERGGAIWIAGGTVKAYGGTDAAGIGGGEDGDSGSIVINGGDVYASGDGYGVGIGAGEDSDVDNTISINGGIVDAYGGLDIRRAIGGEDDEDYSHISIGDGMLVYDLSNSKESLLPNYYRGLFLSSYIRLKFSICKHENQKKISYTPIDREKHTFYCSLCQYSEVQEHDFDKNNDCEYCKLNVPVHTVHFYEYYVSTANLMKYKEVSTLTVSEGDPYYLPGLSEDAPTYYSFKGWSVSNEQLWQPDRSTGVNTEITTYMEEGEVLQQPDAQLTMGTDGDIYVYARYSKLINYDANNEMLLSSQNGQKVDFIFRNRALNIGPKWQTICLPFDLNSLEGTLLEGCTLMELDEGNCSLESRVLTMAYKKTNSIKAGTPYLVKREEGSQPPLLVSPIFSDVILNDVYDPWVSFDDNVFFEGLHAPRTITDGLQVSLFMGDDDRLHWYSGKDKTVKSSECVWYYQAGQFTALRAIILKFDDGSTPIVELVDGKEADDVLTAFGDQEVNASIEGRVLSAVQQEDGTWQSRAYTVCLPFYADLLDADCDFTIYSKAEVTQDGELLFTQEMLPFLYPGNAYLIVVNEGTLRLQEEAVTLTAEAKGADDDSNAVLLNYANDQIAGHWLGSLKPIGHDEAVRRNAFTLASDGSFQRITDDNPTWKWPAYRAMFCATDLMTADKLTTKYQLDANGVEDEEVDRSQPAPDSYQGDNDGEATGIAPVIHTIDRDGTERWFDLNGRQLSGKPTQKGVYIHRGKKQVVK